MTSTIKTLATFGTYTVIHDRSEECYPFEVRDADGDVWDNFDTAAEALAAARRQADEDRAQALRDRIEEALSDCDSVAALEAALALLTK